MSTEESPTINQMSSNMDGEKPASTKRILIAEDDSALRQMFKQTLTYLGYEVLLAKDGEEAWSEFETHQPDLVISDIYMPKLNGLHLLRAIRRNDPAAKVILITGYGQPKQLFVDKDSRPDGYFEKPILLPDLVKKIENLIGAVE